MKRVLKWAGVALGTLVVILGLALVILYATGRSRLGTRYAIDAESVPIRTDSATLARGEHLVNAVLACGECHGERLAGMPFFDEPALGTVVSANLTAADLGAAIGHMKSIPPVDRTPPTTDLEPLAFIMTAAGQLDELIPAEYVDHEKPFPESVPEGPTRAYGRYLLDAAICRDCHGEELAGGQAGPGEPIGPNLTPAGSLSEWTEEDFVRLMRTGVRPDGRQVIDFMPWDFYQDLTDVELSAIWRYLRSLEPVQTPAEFAVD